jgi:arylsulfatase A-like enzyme
VVWDTVRADHLSLYGYPKPTTPRLERWARGARVFTDARAPASSTVPSHASLFTGLLPSEHGTHAGHPRLDDRWITLAELLHGAGYRTYLWAANPHLSASKNFTQGFEREEHPWSPAERDEAQRIVLAKLRPQERDEAHLRDLAGTLPGRLKAAGSLAARDALAFAAEDPARPWFVFINYMEAHKEYLPPRRYREMMLPASLVELSYDVNGSAREMWSYVLGAKRFGADERTALVGSYDAAIRELDDLFADLLDAFEARGLLDDTVVALVADHGELLGEHGLLDHQYSLYEPLIHVPLLLRHPSLVEPGVTSAPVMTLDLFPTLLELAGIAPPAGQASQAASLLRPQEGRIRLAEYPAVYERPLERARELEPGADLSRWERRLRALQSGSLKLIEGEDGRDEIYDLAADPGEAQNLVDRDPSLHARLRQELDAYVHGLHIAPPSDEPVPAPSRDEKGMLEALGYADEQTPPPTPPRQAGTSSWSITDPAPPR